MFICIDKNGVVCLCVDVFSQVSDSIGVLVQSKFDSFLREALKLPTAVHEGPSFGYTHTLARSCFPQQVHTHLICLTFITQFVVHWVFFCLPICCSCIILSTVILQQHKFSAQDYKN